MTTTARITLTTSASTAYTASIAAGSSITLKATGLVGFEAIDIEGKNAAGGFAIITERDGSGHDVALQLTERRNSLTLKGPLDYRLNKPITSANAGVDEYS